MSETLYQECESCHDWTNERDLLWDLEEDRMVCQACHDLSTGLDTKQRERTK